MIRIVLAEDQALVLEALARILELESGVRVVGKARDGESALALVRSAQPDLLVTDIEMPGLSGLDVAAQLATERRPVRVVIVTTFGRPGYLRRALQAGVRGYLLKDTPIDGLVAAVRQVAAGGVVISPELTEEAWGSGEDPLTDRERAVLRLADEGRSAKQIARDLALAPGTVRNYLSEACQKLSASNRMEACRIARRNGWL